MRLCGALSRRSAVYCVVGVRSRPDLSGSGLRTWQHAAASRCPRSSLLLGSYPCEVDDLAPALRELKEASFTVSRRSSAWRNLGPINVGPMQSIGYFYASKGTRSGCLHIARRGLGVALLQSFRIMYITLDSIALRNVHRVHVRFYYQTSPAVHSRRRSRGLRFSSFQNARYCKHLLLGLLEPSNVAIVANATSAVVAHAD